MAESSGEASWDECDETWSGPSSDETVNLIALNGVNACPSSASTRRFPSFNLPSKPCLRDTQTELKCAGPGISYQWVAAFIAPAQVESRPESMPPYSTSLRDFQRRHHPASRVDNSYQGAISQGVIPRLDHHVSFLLGHHRLGFDYSRFFVKRPPQKWLEHGVFGVRILAEAPKRLVL